MGILILYILLICIWHSILFFGYDLGLNVILFMIPLLVLIYYSFKKCKKINNKYGLLFMIPIILLSCGYFIYDNTVMKVLNGIVITLLFTLLYLYTIKPTYVIGNIIRDIFSIICEPFNVIDKFYREIKPIKHENKTIINYNVKNKVISVIIILPIVLIVLLLLGSADMMFNNLFSGFYKFLGNIININIDDIFARIIIIFALFTYLGSVIYFLMYNYKDLNIVSNSSKKIENFTVKLLLTVLNFIYVVFDIIQIRSLFFHQVSTGIKYAEYARSGFFQLMIISIINLVIILVTKKVKEKDNGYIKISSLIMVFLTLIIIISSFMRMNLYEAAYGYTFLRLTVYLTLITEIILLLPTVFYIIKDNINIVKYYLIILTVVYTIFGLSPIDYIIAKRNINRYYNDSKLDIEYLMNYSYDNISLLVDLYNKTDDNELKTDLYNYLKTMKNDSKIKSFQEYNISRSKGLNVKIKK